MFKFKNTFLLFLIFINTLGFSQTQVSNSTSLSLCGCPGEVWDISVVGKPSVAFMSPGHSKRVMFSKYGFTIPPDAFIIGVEMQFSYVSTALGTTLNDENVQLLYWGALGGIDKSTTTGAYSGTNTIILGGPTDLWNWTLTPADVNSDGFGFNFKLNSTAAGTQFAFLSNVQITVYYQNPNGIIESQKSFSGAKISVNNKRVDFISEYNQPSEITIYNLLGEKIATSSSQANSTKEFDLSQFEKGLYTYTLKSNGKEKAGKFLLD